MNTSSRRAFSFFEVMVVVTVLLIMFSLFLPAVLRVRMLAGRSSSANNMKQLGIACHSYHDTNNHFPPGNDANNFSASAYMLPYIEQDALFKLIDFKQASTSEANKAVRATRINTFLSPQDTVKTVTAEDGATNYLFNAGTKFELEKNDGIFFQDSKLKFAEVTDGTSNTVMIGETLKGDGGDKAMTVLRQHVKLDKDALKKLNQESGVDDFKNDKNISGERCARWIDGRFLQGCFTASRLLNDDAPDVDCGGLGGLSALRSAENGAVHLAFCDGSVRLVSKKIKGDIWKALATRDGNEVVNLNDL